MFVLGFSLLLASYGAALGSPGEMLLSNQRILLQVLGGLTILLGLLFAGVLGRFPLAWRVFRPAARPKAGLAEVPLLGVMFGLGWTPCIGPALAAVLTLALAAGSAARGAVQAFAYALGIGIPFPDCCRTVPAGDAAVPLRPPPRRPSHPGGRRGPYPLRWTPGLAARFVGRARNGFDTPRIYPGVQGRLFRSPGSTFAREPYIFVVARIVHFGAPNEQRLLRPIERR
ncbi:MAG: cytochrome c biogenesis CcdA family protein, partial [Streptosporangiaceae bacterium]